MKKKLTAFILAFALTGTSVLPNIVMADTPVSEETVVSADMEELVAEEPELLEENADLSCAGEYSEDADTAVEAEDISAEAADEMIGDDIIIDEIVFDETAVDAADPAASAETVADDAAVENAADKDALVEEVSEDDLLTETTGDKAAAAADLEITLVNDSQESIYLASGETANIIMNASASSIGYQEAAYQWYILDKTMSDFEAMSGETGSILTITGTGDPVYYYCEACDITSGETEIGYVVVSPVLGELKEDVSSVSLQEGGYVYQFTPGTSGLYSFYTTDDHSDNITLSIQDAGFSELSQGTLSQNTLISVELEKDQRYYLFFNARVDGSGTMAFHMLQEDTRTLVLGTNTIILGTRSLSYTFTASADACYLFSLQSGEGEDKIADLPVNGSYVYVYTTPAVSEVKQAVLNVTAHQWIITNDVVEVTAQEKKDTTFEVPVTIHSSDVSLTYSWTDPKGVSLGETTEPELTVSDAASHLGGDYTCEIREKGTSIKKYVYFNITKVLAAQVSNTVTASNITKAASTSNQTFALGAKNKGGVSMTYKSANSSVKVSSDGKVTIPANFVGEAKITITAKETVVYKAASKTVLITVNPASVKLSSVKNKAKKKLVIKWKKNVKADGYEVQYSKKSSFASAKTKTIKKAKTTSLTVKKLTNKKTYYVRVRTFKTVNGKKYYSAWSNVKKAKIKK